jgi:hypothetical protein
MGYDDPFHALLPYLPYVILLLILFRRARMPRILRPWRLWIGPAIFLVLMVFYATVAATRGPPLHAQDWLIIFAACVVGAAVGVLRAHLVHVTLRPDGQLETRLPIMGVAFIIVWVAGRQWLRNSGWVNANSPFSVYADAGLALGFGLLVAHAIALSRRCQALLAANKPMPADIAGGAV